MTVKVKKPILVAGLGLSFLLWLGEALQEQAIAIGEWSLLSLMAIGTGVWWWQKKQPQKQIYQPLSPLSITEVNQAIFDIKKVLNVIKKEDPECNLLELENQAENLPEKLNDKSISVGIVSDCSTVTSSLNKLLIDQENRLKETKFLKSSNLENVNYDADLIIFLMNTDLSETQWQVIQKFHENHQRCLIAVDESEQHNSEEKEIILQQIRQRVKSLIPGDAVIGIISQPNSLKVRQYQDNNSYQEWTEKKPPNISSLTNRIELIVSQEREQLIWGKVWRAAQQVKQQAKQILNKIRLKRALPMMEKYQWIAAATAFANPVASLDLLATVAINTQMVADLSNIYQQKFTLSQAQVAAGSIGKLMLKLGLVELSTHAISGLLKSNAITYVAGGTVQGISAAYLTRVAGLSLVEYFQEQDISIDNNQTIDVEKLSKKIKQVFEQTKRTQTLQSFVKQTIPKLSSVENI
ncbi:YcjF family protein [Crocosphaera sp. Alani8]|uniref:YcjF family protein n=1 Tax=Crocosphaera sp. Alani8 TaxID=3038952 RepID=UPI00313F358F